MLAWSYFGTRVRFPPPPLSKSLSEEELEKQSSELAANGQQSAGPYCQLEASYDASVGGPSVRYLTEAWPKLPPHLKEAVITLVDAALALRLSEGGDQ
jgi:hypothetical protein